VAVAGTAVVLAAAAVGTAAVAAGTAATTADQTDLEPKHVRSRSPDGPGAAGLFATRVACQARRLERFCPISGFFLDFRPLFRDL